MKKWFLRIGLGIFFSILLLYGFLMMCLAIPATVNDKELQFPRASIPEGSNAFNLLQTASSHLWWPDKQSDQIDDLTRDTNWNDALAGTVLASNRETLAGWDAAAKLPDFQVPELSSFDDLMPYLVDWKKLARLAMVRENVLFHNGQDKEAFDQIVTHIQIGRRMQNAHGPLIDYLVGTAVNSVGLFQIQHWAGKTHLTPEQLKDYIRQLQLDPDEEGTAFANTIKAEYQWQVEMLEAIRQGKITNSDPDDFYFRPVRFLPLFNFRQTKALFAEEDLKLVKASPHHFGQWKLPDLESNRLGFVSMYLSGNAGGQILYYMSMSGVIPSLATKSKCDVQLQATRTILALRAYQLTHGNLPPDLSALVPEFLDTVPVDDFDGQRLRYSPERKIVYSVGRNLKDDGGSDRGSDTEPESQRHLDLVFKFDF